MSFKRAIGPFVALFALSACTASSALRPEPANLASETAKAQVSFKFSLPTKGTAADRTTMTTDFTGASKIKIWITGERNTSGVYQEIAIVPGQTLYNVNMNVVVGRNLKADIKVYDASENELTRLRRSAVFSCQPGNSQRIAVNWKTTMAASVLSYFETPASRYVNINATAVQAYIDRLSTMTAHPVLIRVGPIQDAIQRLLNSGVAPAALTADLIAGQVATTSADFAAHPEFTGGAVLPGGIPILVQLFPPDSQSSTDSIPVPIEGFNVIGSDASGNGVNDSFTFVGPNQGPGSLTVLVNDPVTGPQNFTGNNLMIQNLPPGIWTVSIGGGVGYSPKPWFELAATASCDLRQILPTANATASFAFRDVSQMMTLSGTPPKNAVATSQYNGSWFDFEGDVSAANTFLIKFSNVTSGKSVYAFSEDPSQQATHSIGVTSGTLTLTNTISRCYVYLPNIGATVTVSN